MLRKKRKSKVNKDAWLAIYSDMITLLLVFFILLYSISTIDKEKYKILVKAFTADPVTLEQLMLEEKKADGEKLDKEGGAMDEVSLEDIKDLEDLYNYLSKYVEENNLEDSVRVAKGDNLVYIRFMSTLFFEPDQAVLKQGAENILQYIGGALAVIEPRIKYIRIDGHTAEAPGSSDINDRDLSTERANEVLKYLEGRYVKDPVKLFAVGYGRYRPVAPNDTEINRAKNRRVEILITNKDNLQDELDKIYETDN
ncbi:MAG: OmpA/MotB family protein [Anaerovoracaceae bacterium]|jgi:chemotaxis protein MotB